MTAASTAASAAYIDRAVHHRIALGRYSNGVVRRVLALLAKTEIDIVSRIQTVEPGSYGSQQMARLLDEVQARIADGYAVIDGRLQAELHGLAGVEAHVTASSIAKTGAQIVFLHAPSTSQIVAAAMARPFQGTLLREALSGLEAAAATRVRSAIRQGFIEGRSPADIARTLRGTRAARYRDGLMQVSRRSAEAITRTAITHFASVAANETYLAFAEVVESVVWVSVLDSRTSLTCISLNGRVFRLNKGPRPPAHWNCRSTTVANLKDFPMAPIPSYGDWLARQTTAQQDDILGRARAALWRNGAPLEAFTDNKGKALTLQQLRTAA